MTAKLTAGQSFGSDLKSCNVAGLMLAERTYAPGFRTPRHSHENAFFCLILQGRSTETYSTRTRECNPHTLLFHPADELQSEHFHSSGGRCFIIELEHAWADRLGDYAAVLQASAGYRGGTLNALAAKLYKEFRGADEASPLVIEGLMLEMLGEGHRLFRAVSGRKPPRWLNEVTEHLRARFAETSRLNDLARMVSVHPVHLAQAFRHHHRCTVGEYVRQLRLEFACRQLITSGMPLSEVALRCGFSDQSHFTRTFKRHTGMSPSQFRKLLSKP